ncbi:hypothetical protein ACLOJK_022456 [Asimina triloba]
MLCYTSLLPHAPSISTDELVSDELLEAIEVLERMAYEPADVLEACSLSACELYLILVYFSQAENSAFVAITSIVVFHFAYHMFNEIPK